jgi:hypothetical protein
MDAEFCFTVGVPGSSWSMLSNRLKIHLDQDLTDITQDRTQLMHDLLPTKKDETEKVHHGSYFGPYNEFGENFHDIPNNYTVESFYEECRKPFHLNDKTKNIRSHWFSYNLDWLWNNCKGNSMFLIYRSTADSLKWWRHRGGWNIKHPIYTWYVDDNTMEEKITQENQLIFDFVERKNLEWKTYDENWWFDEFGKHELILPNRPKPEKVHEQIKVIYTDIV